MRIEQAFEAADDDLDIDNQGGVLTVTFADRSKLIVSRQTPLRQLWVAARSGGFHFGFHNDVWRRDQDGVELTSVLTEIARTQGGLNLTFSL